MIDQLRKGACGLAMLGLLAACEQENRVFEVLPAEQVGIEFSNDLTETDDFNILDYLYFYNGGGVAVGDINGDGLPDIYLSGNQVKNKLYLNKGNMQFEDITDKAGVAGRSDWQTGAVMGDVNGDGLLDIYVCAVVGLKGMDGSNELYINNGDLTFTESAAAYGLDFDTYSSSAAFLDYDQDGDLDLYLLNQAVHTQGSFGKAELRLKRNYESGDRLLRNDGKKFVDVSEVAGIFGGINGYGLGVSVADFNKDGYPDIYIGNDFHEDDYFYVNNGDGTFSEQLKEFFGHTSRFSMGNDVADINGDGWPDLMSLDMLPDDERVLKSSEGDESYNIMKLRVSRYGYHYQYSRNMLQVNNGGTGFSESALLSGVSATDWSWGALFADYDQDGQQDLFISNGIPRRPNDLDYINFVSNDQIQNKINETKLVDQKALEMMPDGAAANRFFKGTKGIGFSDVSDAWVSDQVGYSTATALADLDGDGDLDMVVNNVNATASIYQNQTNASANYLKFRLKGKGNNHFGIGARISLYQGGQLQYRELYTVRGFQSSSDPVAHFGLGQANTADSVVVVWPDSSVDRLQNVTANQLLEISQSGSSDVTDKPANSQAIFKMTSLPGLNFRHEEDRYTDFDRQKLIPYQIADRGPAVVTTDLNGDKLDDIFIGGSKFEPAVAFYQGADGFQKIDLPAITSDSVNEQVAAGAADFNGDGLIDLVVGNGGADFFNKMKPLTDSYYQGGNDGFEKASFPSYFGNTSVIAPCDFDHDGDMDIFLGTQSISSDYGNIPKSVLLRNENGNFEEVANEQLAKAGMITDATWTDYDGDGWEDLLLVGEWMSPVLFRNESGQLKTLTATLPDITGLWQSVAPFDIDGDGDLDYLLGNWGLNSKFTASAEYPLQMFYGDFDNNGSTETVLATAKKGKYYPLEGLDELASQMVSLRKVFTSYESFAGKTVDQVFGDRLQRATKREVALLSSGYLLNDDGQFRFVDFPETYQLAPIMDFVIADFDADGREEVIVGGNYHGVKPFHGRLDGFTGGLVRQGPDFMAGHEIGLELKGRSVRELRILNTVERPYLLVVFNNDSLQVYQYPY